MTDQQGQQPDRIVIGNDDLDDSIPIAAGPPTTPPLAPPTQTLPNLSAQAAPMPVHVAPGSGSGLVKLSANTVISGLIAGLLGGVVGMLLAENIKNPANMTADSLSELRVQTGIWVAIFGAGLGFLLMAWDGFTTGNAQRGWIDGAKGAGIGAVAGFVGGWIAQYLYTEMLEDVDLFSQEISDIENKLRIARTVAWAVFGGLAGLGLGLNGGRRKMVNGLIGGAVGGAIGGLVFEQIEISQMDSLDPWSPFLVRLIGLTLTGVGIGLGMGLVERLRRDAWLLIAGGPMAGKEFILYNDRTTIGADYRADIVLVKDPSVAPEHLSLVRDPAGGVTLAPGAGAVVVNGTPVMGSQRLRSGDRLRVGASELVYQERAAAT